MKRYWQSLFHDIQMQPKLMIMYSACILFPLLLFGSVLFFIQMAQIKTEVTAGTTQLAKHINISLNEYLREMETISYMSYNNQELQNHLIQIMENSSSRGKTVSQAVQAIDTFLDDVLTVTDNIDFISIISNDDKTYTKSIYGPVRMNNLYLEEEMLEPLLRSHGETVVLPKHIADFQFAPPTPVFSVARKLLDFNSGYYIGYLLLYCNLNVLDRIANDTQVGSNGFWFVLTGSDQMLYAAENNLEKGWETQLISRLQKQTNGSHVVEFMGTKYLYVQNVSSKTGFRVVCMLPYIEVTQMGTMTIVLFVILAVAILLLAVLCSAMIAKSIVLPIRKMRAAMKRAQEGDLTVTVPAQGKNELGELAGNFNELVCRIGGLIETNRNIDMQRKIAEMEALKSKINPHFLYNTLETIRMQAVINDETEIAGSVTSLAKMLRYSISGTDDFVTLEKEITHVTHYLYLQKMRYQDKFEVEIHASPASMSCQVLKLTLQPIVENALQHGIEKKKGKVLLQLTAELLHGNLHIYVKDNGAGMNEERLHHVRRALEDKDAKLHGEHIGLQNVQSRIQLIFGTAYGMQINSTHHEGTCVELKLPARSASMYG
ncbi:hypothetical protein SY83_02070 [Paenibacillus swuensis]|uniref:HAMP domain-containing protein n=1 Tax=Paenibacillus swuensis TaxID=1178515 RepID=A0A172TE30_9BACL|nr:sensor histidine kinase [Paenibacillus swuensis]ANE45315.1 hypothetical protein SY83_02070 [Paenibacillus swuensis]